MILWIKHHGGKNKCRKSTHQIDGSHPPKRQTKACVRENENLQIHSLRRSDVRWKELLVEVGIGCPPRLLFQEV